MDSNASSLLSRINPARPGAVTALLVMGKTQGTKSENKQLRARVALAAALWHTAEDPKPYVLFVAADVHGSLRTLDARVVESTLTDEFRVPPHRVLARSRSSCTLIEVRAARVLSRKYGLDHMVAVTHPYHALRVHRYLEEVLPSTSVVAVHPDVLDGLVLPAHCSGLFRELRETICDSMPVGTDLRRERIVESLLTLLHTLDPRGRFERRLAKLVRRGNQSR